MNLPSPTLIGLTTLIMAVFTASPLQGQNNYQTFDFLDFNVKVLTEHQVNEQNVEYLKTVIPKELESKGLQKATNPDLVVNIGLVVEEEVQTRETDIRDMRYMGQRNYHWEVEEVPVGIYKMGTVSVELVDTGENKVVWRGQEKNVINKNPSKVRKKIDKGVARMFKKFDPSEL
jgi:hypothetical protein